MAPSLLDQIRGIITINVDSMDPEVALRHKPCREMTSNQCIAYIQGTQPENAPLVEEAKAYVQKHGHHATQDSKEYLLDVADVLTILLAKKVYPHITGKVLAQSSPSFASDVEKTKAHAKRLVNLFEAHGIDRSRCCIKILATPEGITACKQLQEEGINTLATAVVCWEQTIAAMQAKCIFTSPYLNELQVHFDKALQINYADTAAEHPSSAGVRTAIDALRGSGTIVMPASLIYVEEIIALVSFRPECITIPAGLLDELAALPEVPAQQLAPRTDLPNIPIDPSVDYVSNVGAGLREVFVQQPEVARKVAEAIEIFGSFEKKSMEFVRSGKLDVEWTS